MCDRRRGIGADGVISLLPSKEAELEIVIQNADGSVPEMCGNGLRCVIDVVAPEPGVELSVMTGAGLRTGRILPDGEIEVTLGAGHIRKDAVNADLGGVTVSGTHVDMGNPHLVLFIETPKLRDQTLFELADRFGPALERHPEFPNRVNVGFARVHEEEVELVVFERGSGRTEACGTGAGACALVAHVSGRWKAPGPIPVRLPGGRLRLQIPKEPGEEILLIGPTARAFEGTWLG